MPRRECSVNGCTRASAGKGLCATHYKQVQRGETPHIKPDLRSPDGSCRLPGCGRVAATKKHGLCKGHQQRLAKYGDVQEHIPLAPATRKQEVVTLTAAQQASNEAIMGTFNVARPDHKLTDDELEAMFGPLIHEAVLAFAVDASYGAEMVDRAKKIALREAQRRAEAVES